MPIISAAMKRRFPVASCPLYVLVCSTSISVPFPGTAASSAAPLKGVLRSIMMVDEVLRTMRCSLIFILAAINLISRCVAVPVAGKSCAGINIFPKGVYQPMEVI